MELFSLFSGILYRCTAIYILNETPLLLFVAFSNKPEIFNPIHAFSFRELN